MSLQMKSSSIHPYIIESMARVGCGISDIKEIAAAVGDMSPIDWDVLDSYYNHGDELPWTEKGLAALSRLREAWTDDDMQALGAYVNASRNIGELGNA